MTNAQSNRGIKAAQRKTTRGILDKWELVNRINGDARLNPSAKVVAIYLMWRMNCQWETCFPSRERVASDTHLSLRTVAQALLDLKGAGWVTWQRRHETSSVYSFVWDAEQPAGYVEADKIPQSEDADSAHYQHAESAPKHREQNLTQEDSQASVPTGQNPGGEGKAKASRPTPSRTGDATTDAIWQQQLPEMMHQSKLAHLAMKARPPSGGSMRGRTGKLIKDHGAPAVWQAFETTIKAEPGGCPFDYATKLLAEQNSEEDKARALLYAPIDYR